MSGSAVPLQKLESEDAARAVRELDRLQKLLEDAVPLLMYNFERIAELSAAQGRLLEETLNAPAAGAAPAAGPGGDEASVADRIQLARTYDACIKQHLHSTVTALQFDDLAVQLIAHVRDRIVRVEGGPARPDEGSAWQQRTYGPVSAEGISSGSVELF